MGVSSFPPAEGGGGSSFLNYVIDSSITKAVTNGLYKGERFPVEGVLNALSVNNQDVSSLPFIFVDNEEMELAIDPPQWNKVIPVANRGAGVAYKDGVYLAVGGSSVSTSSDLITWTNRTISFAGNSAYSVTVFNGLFIIGGGSGRIGTSPDGITWTSRNVADIGILVRGVSSETMSVLSGGDNALVSSPDGINWTIRTPTAGRPYLNFLAYGGGMFATGGDAYISSSPDGITWTARTPAADNFGGGTYGNGQFVTASGSSGQMSTSPDGITWSVLSTPFSGTYINRMTFGNGQFIVSGISGLIKSSPDLITWTDIVISGFTGYPQASSFANNYYFLTNNDNDNLAYSTTVAGTARPSGVSFEYLGEIENLG
jgi:hypothetical protein